MSSPKIILVILNVIKGISVFKLYYVRPLELGGALTITHVAIINKLAGPRSPSSDQPIYYRDKQKVLQFICII